MIAVCDSLGPQNSESLVRIKLANSHISSRFCCLGALRGGSTISGRWGATCGFGSRRALLGGPARNRTGVRQLLIDSSSTSLVGLSPTTLGAFRRLHHCDRFLPSHRRSLHLPCAYAAPDTRDSLGSDGLGRDGLVVCVIVRNWGCSIERFERRCLPNLSLANVETCQALSFSNSPAPARTIRAPGLIG